MSAMRVAVGHDRAFPFEIEDDGDGSRLAKFVSQDEAFRFARAVNAHADLVSALNDVLSHACLHPRDFDGQARSAVNRANALLDGLSTTVKGEQS